MMSFMFLRSLKTAFTCPHVPGRVFYYYFFFKLILLFPEQAAECRPSESKFRGANIREQYNMTAYVIVLLFSKAKIWP